MKTLAKLLASLDLWADRFWNRMEREQKQIKGEPVFRYRVSLPNEYFDYYDCPFKLNAAIEIYLKTGYTPADIEISVEWE